MAVGTILGVSYRKQTASFGCEGGCYASCLGDAISLIGCQYQQLFAQTLGASLQAQCRPSGLCSCAAIEIRNAEQGGCELFIGR